ncbi:MAG: hypothetical protein R2823_05750 [Acidimicrobiia bacterium]
MSIGVFLSTLVGSSLVFAVVGWFLPVTAAICAVAALALSVAAWRALSDASLRLPTRLGTIGIAALCVAFIVTNAVFAGEHMTSERDQGTYLNTAQWLRNHGDLLVDGGGAPFPVTSDIDPQWNTAFDVRDDGRMYIQFSHGFPTVLATVGTAFGTRAMLWVNPVLGGLVLLLLYLALLWIVHELAALLLIAVLAMNVSFYFFFRDTFAEPLTLALVAVAVLCTWMTTRTADAVPLYTAAACIGVLTSVRLDGWLFVTGWLLILTVWLIRSQGLSTRVILRSAIVTLGVASIGIVDLWLRSPVYVTQRADQVIPMGLAVGFSMGAFAAVYLARARLRGWDYERVFGTAFIRLRVAGVLLVGLASAFMLFVRPTYFKVHGAHKPWMENMQRLHELPIDGTVKLYENSLRWFTWYWGWVVVIAALVGVCFVIWRSVAGPSIAMYALVIVSVALAVYLAWPSIAPDHMWVMRRFLAPGVVFIIFGLAVSVQELVGWWPRMPVSAFTTRLTVVVGALLFVVVATGTSWGLFKAAPHRPLLDTTLELCSALPDDAAVVAVGRTLGHAYAPAIRTFCDVPVVWWLQTGVLTLAELAAHVERNGHRLVVLSDGSRSFDGRVLFSETPEIQVPDVSLLAVPQSVALRPFPLVAELVES